MTISSSFNAPLYNKLLAYSSSKLPFHMPGHKYGTIADISELNLSLLDNTEVAGLDNLYDAKDVIKQAMELMADFYGALNTLFLTNGSTAGILASILSICKDGDKIITARNCHHSVWSALALSGAHPVYVSPSYLKEDSLLGEITSEDIKRAFKLHPDAKGVIIVSPTYEGIVSDITAIAEVVHEYNSLLIVDEAHGAHFVLGEHFPVSSIHQHADIVINSMHKTLPALTQSALLHICSDRVDYDQVLSALRMVQTSSPSYLMMGLMDYIRGYISDNKSIIKASYTECLIELRKKLKGLKYLRLFDPENKAFDISKIVISTCAADIDGYQLAEILNEEYNIMIEAAFSHHIILMTTMADNIGTLSQLEQALSNIDSKLSFQIKSYSEPCIFSDEVILGMNVRKIYHAEKEYVSVNQCSGCTSSKNIMLYPPGIPIICIGEIFTEECIKLVTKEKDKLQGVKLIGDEILIEVAIQ